MWAMFNRFVLEITKAQVLSVCLPGDSAHQVEILSKNKKILRQLEKLPPSLVREELKEYGAWPDQELADHKKNLLRLLWLACWNIYDLNQERMRKWK